MADNYIKRPSDVLDAVIDLRDFVAEVAAQGIAPEDVTFRLRNDPGINVTSTMPEIGLLKLRVSGGVMGRVYLVGAEASTPDGDSQIEMSRVRVRDPSLFDSLPPGTTEETTSTYVDAGYVDAGYVL